MSVQVAPRKTLVVNQSMVASNTFTVDMKHHLTFQPKHMCIKQLIYANIAGTDLGTYLLWSSVHNDFVGALYIGIQSAPTSPDTIISLHQFTDTIQFMLTPANGAYVTPTGNLTLTLEFY